MLRVAVPWMIEQVHAHARLRESARDDVVVLAEGTETQLLRETRLVLRRAGRVVAPPRNVGAELAHRLEMHGLRVVEQSLLAEPRLGDHSAPFGPRGDEERLVPCRDQLRP